MNQPLDNLTDITEPTAPASGERAGGRSRAAREAVAVGLVMLLVIGSGVVGTVVTSVEAIRSTYNDHLQGLAVVAAQQIDPALHGGIREPGQIDSPDYDRAVGPLRRLRATVPSVAEAYTVVADGDVVRFVLDAAASGDADGDGIEDRAGVWETYEDTAPSLLQALGLDGKPPRPTVADQPYTDKWGTYVSGYAPIYAADGTFVGVVGIDFDASDHLAQLAAARYQAMIGFLPSVALVLVFCALFYRLRRRGLAAAASLEEAVVGAQRGAAALARERRRLQTVLDATAVCTWEWDVATGKLNVNEQFARITGLQVPALDALTVAQVDALTHPDDRQRLHEALRATLEPGGAAFEIEYRLRHAQGHWVWTCLRGSVVERDPAGQALLVAGTNQDVTQRLQSEMALRESEARFRGFFLHSPVGIVLNDLNGGRFLDANDAMLAALGYSREEFLQLSYRDITPLAYAGQDDHYRDQLVETGRYGPYEKEYIRRDGSRLPVVLSGIRVVEGEGRGVIWSIVQDASQRRKLELQLMDAASRDRLTGLANRNLFMRRLSRALARQAAGEDAPFAVMFLDFDHFKVINDAMGHDAGDELLREVAARLSATLRAGDALGGSDDDNVVARFGGDEFVVLLNDLVSSADAPKVAERILNALAPAYSLNGREVHCSASIGIVTSDQCTESPEAIVRNADVAMYEAKRLGRSCSVVFNEAMHTRLARHLTIESALRKALGTDQLVLHYQPIVELDSGRMVSVEALVRWKHPQLGNVSPAEFIPVAEQSGLIVPLGAWVLQEACRQLVEWRRSQLLLAPGVVTVNVSRAELALGDELLRRVRETLISTGLPPRCLQLEVTEREVMRDPEATRRLMHELRAIGVRLAMDDFGTGTSSLACLRDYPFDTIKIDRSFVTDLAGSRDGMAVIHATITLVANLGMASVAEGVETAEQVAILQSLGCCYAQGYFFSRPRPPAELMDAARAAEETVRLPAPVEAG